MDSIFDTNHLAKSYFKLALPVTLGMVVTLIYNLADTFFIALTGDTNLIAGVSLCAPVFTALMAFGNIFGQGGSSLISRMLGAKDDGGAARVSSFCFYAALVTGVVLAILMGALNRPLLSVLGATTETFSHAFDYYIVMVAGAPIVVLSFIHSNLVRCEGMATQSMAGTVLGAVVNIVLDPLLIFAAGMGAGGAAVASVIGYACSDVYFLVLVRRKSRYLSIAPSHCRTNREELGQILGVGVTAALANLMQSLAMIMLNQFLLPYGNDKIAAMGVVLKINMIAQLILTGFAFGGMPLLGYLYGADEQRELKRLIRFCLGFICALSAAFTVLLCLCAEPLVGAFLSDATLRETGVMMLRWQAITTIFAGIVLLLTVLFQGTGKVAAAFIMSISRQGVVYLAALLACANLLGYDGAIMAQATADIVSAAIGVVLLKTLGNPARK